MSDTTTARDDRRTGEVDAVLYGQIAAELLDELRALRVMTSGSRVDWVRIDARADGLARALSILSGEDAHRIRMRLAESLQ